MKYGKDFAIKFSNLFPIFIIKMMNLFIFIYGQIFLCTEMSKFGDHKISYVQ